MKLNASILLGHLSESFSVEMTGLTPSEELLLPFPKLMLRQDTDFEASHLYVVSADHLPQRPNLPANVVLVCIGDSLLLKRYQENCTLLCIRERCDLYAVYQSVCELYDRLNRWNDRLFELFKGNAAIQDYLDCSQGIFRCPMFVLNANFGVLASSLPFGYEQEKIWERDEVEISQESMEMFLEKNSLALDVHGILRPDVAHASPLCVNLFDPADKYIGCLWIDQAEISAGTGQDALAVYLAGVLEKVLQRNPSLMVNTHSLVRQVLRNLVQNLPLTSGQSWLLNSYSLDTSYVCVSFHLLAENSRMPLDYICNMIELNFSNSIAFPLETTAVGFLNLSVFRDKDGHYEKRLNEQLQSLLYAMKLQCGISNDFSDLSDAAIYYQQAKIAYENGCIARPSANFHYFSSYALMEMVINSLGGLSPEIYFPDGMKKLIAHDDSSETSYLETLRIFLDEKMNYSSAARLLYVHRSTLIDRIHRIEKEVGIDLDDPNERLRLQLLLKAMEIEEIIQEQK